MNVMERRTDIQRRPEEEEEEEEKKKEEEQPLCDDLPPFVVVTKCGGDGGGDIPSPTTTTITTTTTTDTEIPLTFTKKGWGARHTSVGLACMGVILLSMTRYNLSIAIVSMVARPSTAHTPTAHPHDPTDALDGVEAVDEDGGACPVLGNVTVDASLNDSSGGFEWDEREQGLILGAFYYGNVLTNVLGGRMAERVGSKPVILLGMFLSSALSLLSPLAAYISTSVFIAVRLALGFAQGIVMPAVTRYLVMWVPPFKRSKYNTIVYIGSEVGVLLSLSLGGWLCAQTFLGGWPAVFYVFGGAAALWCVAWALLVHETPESHSRITSEEKKYLMTYCVVRQDKVGVPWVLVMRSLPFWALTVMHIGYNWGYYTFVTELPVYLSNIQHFSIKSNGMVSALPYLIKTSFALLFSLLMDRATARGKLSVLSVRRISMVVASYIPAVALVGMCFVGCDSMAAVVVMSAAIGVTGSAFCGLFCSHQDISPHFSGTIYGVTNTLANITGFIAPAVVGVITFENQTLRAWNTVFLISSLIYVVTGTFYVTCISDQVQPFNNLAHLKQVEDGVQEVEKIEKNGGDYIRQHQEQPSLPISCKK